MGEVVTLRLPRTKQRLWIDADQRGHFVQIFPPPSQIKPTWRFASYEAAKAHAELLSDQIGIKIHDAIRPPFLEHFK